MGVELGSRAKEWRGAQEPQQANDCSGTVLLDEDEFDDNNTQDEL
jgi:hypothetical protein